MLKCRFPPGAAWRRHGRLRLLEYGGVAPGEVILWIYYWYVFFLL
jgi:hypothetical protein